MLICFLVLALDGVRVQLVTLQEGVTGALGDSQHTATSNLTQYRTLGVAVLLVFTSPTWSKHLMTAVQVWEWERWVKQWSLEPVTYEGSSSVQTGYLLREMLQWGGIVGSFCDPAWDICLKSFIIMGRRGRPSPPSPPITPSPHRHLPESRTKQAISRKPFYFSACQLLYMRFCVCMLWYTYIRTYTYTCTFSFLLLLFLGIFHSYSKQTHSCTTVWFRFVSCSCEEYDVHRDWWWWWLQQWWQRWARNKRNR